MDINEILLAPVLFLVAFCTLCCQLPRTTSSKGVRSTPKNALTPVVDKPAVTEPVVSEPVAAEPAVSEQAVSEPVAAEPAIAAELYEQAVATINSLSKVQLRKLCKPLGIQQKRNGVELTKELMAGNIKKALRTKPQLVISMLTEKLSIEVVAYTAQQTAQELKTSSRRQEAEG